MNEHVGVDDEVLYLDFGPSYQPQPPPNPKAYESSEDEICSDSDVSDESDDEMVSDRVPDGLPDLNYDKKNPPMAVGTLYSDMDAFKIALATHCAIGEHQYVIDKSDPGRYRVHCKFREELDCPWRIHASALHIHGATTCLRSITRQWLMPSLRQWCICMRTTRSCGLGANTGWAPKWTM